MNQDDLLQFLHSIHNKIRNANGLKLTGLSALNEINNFFALYFIKDKVIKKGLPEECSFDKIYKKYATDEIIKADRKIPSTKSDERMSYLLWQNVYDSNNENCLMRQIVKNEYFSSYFANDVAKASAYSTNVKACDTIQEIINMIYKKFKTIEFNYKMYDALGSAYERFKTDEISNSGKHTGQHFTPVAIKKIIIDELKPTHEDTFYEPCSGSGGFIHTACHYVYEHDNSNLEKFKKKIYANEINPEIQKPLMINMLLHDIPVNHINVENECDSLSKENCKRYMNKMSKCGTNVPFGVKTTLEIFGDYWEPVTNGKNIMKESTAQFIVHIYNCLKDGGIAGIVVDRGILNNGTDGKSWQKKFRKWLLENSDLYKIVYLPTGIFDYTNFATAVIFFKKGNKTKKVDFYEAVFVDSKKKGDIKIGDKPLKSMTVKEIEKQNWSLKIEMEEKDELKVGWVKLGDVVEISSGKFNSKDMDGIGNIPFYSCISNNPAGMHSKHSFNNKKYILFIGSGGSQNNVCGSTIGMGKTYIIHGKSACRSGVFALIPNENTIIEYVKYYLDINRYDINSKANFSANLGVISTNTLKDLKIPSLSQSHQTEIVEFLDEQFKKYNIELLTDKLKDIKLFDLLIAKQYDICADALHLIYRKIETDAFITSMNRDKKAVFNMLLNGCDYETAKLGDVINIESGKLSSSDSCDKGKYPFYSGKPDNPTGKYDKCSFDYEKYILVIKGGGCPEVLTRYDNEHVGMGKVFFVNGKSAVTDGLYCLTLKNEKKTSYEYLYIFMKYNKNKILRLAKFSARLGNIPKTSFEKFEINIPSSSDQSKIIKEIEKIEKEQSNYKQYSDMLQGLIDNIQNVIKKITNDKQSSNKKKSKKSNDKSDSESSESDESDSSDNEKPQNGNKKNESKSESDSSEDKKPKKVNKNKKPVKKIIKVEESDSSNSSESESEDELQKCDKCKKKVKVSKFKKGSKMCNGCNDKKS